MRCPALTLRCALLLVPLLAGAAEPPTATPAAAPTAKPTANSTANSTANPVTNPAEALFARRLPDASGKPTALAAYRGKPLVVNFWARWCAPCREEIPELNRFRQSHAGKVEILGIGLEDNPGEVAEFRRRQPMNYPVFLAGDEAIPLMQALGNRKGALPYTVFIDARGRIVGEKLGRLKAEDLERGWAAMRQP